MSAPRSTNILEALHGFGDRAWPEMEQMVEQAYVWAEFERKRRELCIPKRGGSVRKKLPTDAVLRKLYVDQEWTVAEIAAKFKCAEPSVRDALIRANIPRRSKRWRKKVA